MKTFANNVVEIVTKFCEMRYMKVITNGFMGIAAITICGSIFTLIKSIPFEPWTNFLTSTGLNAVLSIPVLITTDLLALYVVFSIAHNTAKSFDFDGFSASLVAVGSFLLLTPFTTTITDAVTNATTEVSGVIPLSALGAQGIFLAIITGILATRIYIFFNTKGFKIKMPPSVPKNVAGMFESLIPGGLTFVVFLLIRYGLSFTEFGTAQNLIYGLLQKPLTSVSGGYGAIIITTIIGSILWIFGIHGGMVVYATMGSIQHIMIAENMAAFAQGMPAPHVEWALVKFVIMGGAGATLALNVLMVSKYCKSEQYKALGKLALPASLFNINEPLIFGMPIIMNPILALPFAITPLVNLALCMFGYSLGLFVPTGADLSAFMPFIFHGAFLTGSFSGVVMQILMLIVDIIIYLPFFKVADKKALSEELKAKQSN